MPRQLTNLRIDEVSSVDRGAGRGVKVVMTKRETANLDQALTLAIGSILPNSEKAPALVECFKQFHAYLAKEQNMDDAAIAKLVADSVGAALTSFAEKYEMVEKMSPAHSAYNNNLDGDEAKRFQSMGHGDREKYIKENPISTPDSPNDDGDTDVDQEGKKPKPTGGAKHPQTKPAKKVDKMDDSIEIAKRDEKIAKLEADVAKMRDNEQRIEFAKRAKDVGLAEAQGELLLKVSRGESKSFDELLTLVKGLNEQVNKGKLFGEFGTQEGGGIKSAHDELVAKADEIRKADSKLTPEQAYVKAMEQNPELSAREREEGRAKIQKLATN